LQQILCRAVGDRGCFAFWSWLRENRAPWVAAIRVASLIGFAVVLTRAETRSQAGRTRRTAASTLARRSRGYGVWKEHGPTDGIFSVRPSVSEAVR
jgi:hypothetical protein